MNTTISFLFELLLILISWWYVCSFRSSSTLIPSTGNHLQFTQQISVKSSYEQDIIEKSSESEALLRVQKVPTIRIIRNGNLLEEFFPGDGSSFKLKVRSILDQELQKSQPQIEFEHNIVQKFHSSSEAQEFLRKIPESTLLVCKYGAEWCRKCMYLRKTFDKLALEYSGKPISFLDFDIDGVFESSQISLEETSITEQTSNEILAVEDCLHCERTGFIPCSECQSTGFILRINGEHQIADICPTCVGYKKVRCPSCGGKCLMCE